MEIKKRDQDSQELKLVKLKRKQSILERKRAEKKTLIEEYKKMARSWTPAARLSPPKFKRRVKVEKIEEENEQEEKGGFFALTELNANPKKNLTELPPLKVSPKKIAEDTENDFWKLSPRCIIEKINESVKNGEKVRFKGIGLESTLYYRKYMSDKSAEERHEKNKASAEQYFKSVKNVRRANEHVLSFNRIKAQLQKLADKKSSSFMVVLESNLDTAFKRMDRDLNRVTAYAKYSSDFPQEGICIIDEFIRFA
eukprot:TRINITY_DN121800_c0_g1_i1.p2 TRINITY_DN121800_c0_g1~~TRINITY_DN121800_c0_g1_i1.p2  ORF type:complete len:254 (-),score=31.02 TRINITY_DN121800_c0_g1_i1:103-864(-)